MKRTLVTIAYIYCAAISIRIILAATEPANDFPHPFAISIIAALWGAYCALAALSLIIVALTHLASRIKRETKP